MTFLEALEYLNLPANSSDKLVNKRYLELKIDYEKAISNAPSDHFRALYQENLDKIKEAYEFLIRRQRITEKSNLGILNRIQEAQEIVDNFLTEQGEEILNPEARDKIQTYIDQINSFQDDLGKEETETQPTKVPMPSDRWNPKATLLDTPESKETSLMTESMNRVESPPSFEAGDESKEDVKSEDKTKPSMRSRWRWEIKSFRNKLSTSLIEEDSLKKQSKKKKKLEGSFIEEWVINLVLKTWHDSNPGTRRQLYDQAIMIVVLGMLLMGLIGTVYLLYPLF